MVIICKRNQGLIKLPLVRLDKGLDVTNERETLKLKRRVLLSQHSGQEVWHEANFVGYKLHNQHSIIMLHAAVVKGTSACPACSCCHSKNTGLSRHYGRKLLRFRIPKNVGYVKAL